MYKHTQPEEDTTPILRESEKRFGQIHPVIQAADGEVISGEHRLKVNPKWKREKREDISDPFDKVAFRFAANVQRQMSTEEKSRLLQQAFILLKRREPNKEFTIEEFANRLGVTKSLVMTYGRKCFPKKRDYLKVPQGTVCDAEIPRTQDLILLNGEERKQALEERRNLILETVKEVPLLITGHLNERLSIAIPQILIQKYGLSAGDYLIASCSEVGFMLQKGSPAYAYWEKPAHD